MRTLGKYRVMEEVGRGGMGVVYRGHDPFLDRPVAIKIARVPDLKNQIQVEVYRGLFFNEMRAAGLLRHPGIVQIYDAGVEGEDYYIVMEYVQGAETLERYCHGAQLLPVDTSAEIIFKCAESLDYAHRKGVIHRDIKPGNILLERDGSVKLVDFSIALLTHPDIVDTQLLDPVGSPLYMAPEQIREESVTNQSDLFALGVVLYELLTGHHPFAAGSLASVTHRVLNDEPRPVADYRDGVPDSLIRVVARALAKDPTDRYRTALDVAADLSQSFSALKRPQDGVATEGRVEVLRHTRFFDEFRDAEIWELLRWAEWTEYGSGARIITEGEYDDSVYIVVGGTVDVVKADQVVASIGAGECIGEIGYLARCKRSATVVANGSVSALRLNAGLIDRASQSCQIQFQRVFIRTLIDRLVATTGQLVEKDHEEGTKDTKPLIGRRSSATETPGGTT